MADLVEQFKDLFKNIKDTGHAKWETPGGKSIIIVPTTWGNKQALRRILIAKSLEHGIDFEKLAASFGQEDFIKTFGAETIQKLTAIFFALELHPQFDELILKCLETSLYNNVKIDDRTFNDFTELQGQYDLIKAAVLAVNFMPLLDSLISALNKFGIIQTVTQ